MAAFIIDRLLPRSASSPAPVAGMIAGFITMLLVLIPFFAFRVLGEAMGEGRLARMFFVKLEPMDAWQRKPG